MDIILDVISRAALLSQPVGVPMAKYASAAFKDRINSDTDCIGIILYTYI